MDQKETLRNKKKEIIKHNAFNRKVNNQYDILRKWDTGKITGMEAIEAIETEAKLFRVENDLIELNKATPPEFK